jgi:threonine dehydratase
VAQELGIPATVVVPHNASAFKRAAIRRYGARVVGCGPTLAARETTLAKVQAATGANYIPPYDHPAVIAGQGSAALEILDQDPGVDEIWTPVGGGGLASGTVLASGHAAQVVGAEPRLAGDAFASLQRGERQPAMPPRSVADGLRTALGELNFRILNAYQLPIRLVSEKEILAAQKLAMACLKLLIEPSSAVPIAALLKYGPCLPDTRRVVIIVTGGNVTL